MKASIDQQLAALPKMARKDLDAMWQGHFGKQPSRTLRRETIIRILAYRLQEKVLPDGYEYGGRKHGSLSEIARAITGTRWSGPAFFGMKQRAKETA